MIDQKDCTIIIPTLSSTAEERFSIVRCVDSLLETSEMQIVIALNNGINQWNDLIAPVSDRIKLITLEDQGQCKAVNAAAATVNTPWIFVTNDDMIYAPGWWEKLTSNFPWDIKCISPKLIEPIDGAPTFEKQMFGGAGGDFDKDKWLEFAGDYNEGGGGGIRSGFNLPFLISKELWDLIGGYDINYDPWGSNGDSDLEYKIKLAGIQPYQNTNCIVYHFSQTSGTFNPENDSFRFRNYAYFKEKWGFDRTDDGIWEATFEIPNESRIFRPWWEGHYGSK